MGRGAQDRNPLRIVEHEYGTMLGGIRTKGLLTDFVGPRFDSFRNAVSITSASSEIFWVKCAKLSMAQKSDTSREYQLLTSIGTASESAMGVLEDTAISPSLSHGSQVFTPRQRVSVMFGADVIVTLEVGGNVVR
jgi:hypothetical protein